MSSRELLPVALLAGGLATRLRPITETIPKALVPVAGEPFIYHQLRYLAAQGVSRVIVCTGYLGEQIEAAVGDGSRFGLAVTIVPDGPKLLGTAGALKCAQAVTGDTFFVMYGDSFLPCDFAQVQHAFTAARQLALMTVLHNDDKWDTSNVVFVSGAIKKYSKRDRSADMRHIDYGLSVLTAEVLSPLAADVPHDLADVFEGLAARGELAGFEVTERFYEIGSHTGLAETEHYFRQYMPRGHQGEI